MTFTRDSLVWIITSIGTLLTGLLSHFDVLTKAFPSIGASGQAKIELFSFIISIIAGILAGSPLPLSYANPRSGKADPDFVMNPLNPKAETTARRSRRRHT